MEHEQLEMGPTQFSPHCGEIRKLQIELSVILEDRRVESPAELGGQKGHRGCRGRAFRIQWQDNGYGPTAEASPENVGKMPSAQAGAGREVFQLF